MRVKLRAGGVEVNHTGYIRSTLAQVFFWVMPQLEKFDLLAALSVAKVKVIHDHDTSSFKPPAVL